MKLNELNMHLWRVYLPKIEPAEKRLEEHISGEEIEFSKKFRNSTKRTRYILRKGITKLLIAKYTKILPLQIRFCITRFGKPGICCNENELPLGFNLSHSGDWLLLVFGRNHCIGVDVEHIKTDFPVLEIASKFFSQREANAVESSIDTERVETFFRIWVRKEAYVKAVGKGLLLPMDSFEVPLDQIPWGHELKDEKVKFAGKINDRWYFYEILINSEYCSCLVSPFIPSDIKIFDLTSLEDLSHFKLIP